MTKTQAGLRLSVDTWQQIRIAAMQNGVSASNLMDALSAIWLKAIYYDRLEPWAVQVIQEAKSAQKRGPKAENVSKPLNMPLDAILTPETAKNGRKRRLSTEDIENIRADRVRGFKQAEIASIYGISQAYVSRLTRK